MIEIDCPCCESALVVPAQLPDEIRCDECALVLEFAPDRTAIVELLAA